MQKHHIGQTGRQTSAPYSYLEHIQEAEKESERASEAGKRRLSWSLCKLTYEQKNSSTYGL